MSQAESGSILIKRVLLEVSPDIFCHPIWTHFLESGASPSSSLIRDLLDSARYYKDKNDIFASCQILLICACLLKRINLPQEALETIQEARNLAKANGFRRILLWSSWGAAAISIDQGDMLRATHFLDTIQAVVNEENDWVFTDVLELLKRALTRDEKEIGTLGVLIDWLNRWGESPCKFLNCIHGVVEADGGFPGAVLKDKFAQLPRRAWRAVLKRIRGAVSLKRLSKLSPFPGNTVCLHAGQDQIPKFSNPPFLAEQESNLSAVNLRQTGRTSEPDLRGIAQMQKNITSGRPSLAAYCLGKFRVFQDNYLIANWPSGKGRDILKYLLIQRGHSTLKDILMDIFWPEAEPEAARNNLNVAIFGLRQALKPAQPDVSHILYQNESYLINPELEVWTDVAEFLMHFENGQGFLRTGGLEKAEDEFERAVTLYGGDLYEEDLYKDWIFQERGKLAGIYLKILDLISKVHLEEGNYLACISDCQRMLKKDNCNEDAHRRIMICYSRRGHRNLALRQYQICVESLARELELSPSLETVDLHKAIRQGQPL